MNNIKHFARFVFISVLSSFYGSFFVGGCVCVCWGTSILWICIDRIYSQSLNNSLSAFMDLAVIAGGAAAIDMEFI